MAFPSAYLTAYRDVVVVDMNWNNKFDNKKDRIVVVVEMEFGNCNSMMMDRMIDDDDDEREKDRRQVMVVVVVVFEDENQGVLTNPLIDDYEERMK